MPDSMNYTNMYYSTASWEQHTYPYIQCHSTGLCKHCFSHEMRIMSTSILMCTHLIIHTSYTAPNWLVWSVASHIHNYTSLQENIHYPAEDSTCTLQYMLQHSCYLQMGHSVCTNVLGPSLASLCCTPGYVRYRHLHW